MTLREFWNLVVFSRWLVLGAMLLGLVAGLGYAVVRQPTYSATAVVGYVSPDVLTPLGVTLNTDPAGLQGTATRQKVRAALSSPGSLQEYTAAYSTTTVDTVTIAAYASTSSDALTAANTVAKQYVAGLQDQFGKAVDGLQAHRDELAGWLAQNASAGQQSPTGTAIGAQYAATMSLYQQLLTQVAQAKVMSDVASVRTDAVTAQLVSVPAVLVLVIGAVLGGFVGVAAAVVRHALDTKVRSAASLGRVGEVVLGTLSDVGGSERASHDGERLPVAGRSANPFTQSVRELRTTLQATMSDRDGSMLVVTAVEPTAPTGFLTANLAVSFALSGRRVIVVSGDLRQPSLTPLLLPEGRPRSDPLGSVPTRVPNLRVVLPLRTPLDPADYLATAVVRERLDDLRASADLLVMDAPPVLGAADAAILGGYADATLVVATENVTRIAAVVEGISRLRTANARPLGVVIASDRVRGSYQSEYSFVDDQEDDVASHAAETGRPAPMTVPLKQV